MAVRGDRAGRARGVPDSHHPRRPLRRAVPGGDPRGHGAARLRPAGARAARRATSPGTARRHGADRRGRRRARGRPGRPVGFRSARGRPRARVRRALRRPRQRGALGRARRRRIPSPGRGRDARGLEHRVGRLRAGDQTADRRRPLARTTARAFIPAGLFLACAYAALVTGFDRGDVGIVAPLNATQSLWGVVFAAAYYGRAEAIGRRTVLASLLVVLGGALIGAFR